MEILEVKYALDTFYFLICGALVMWMAAGFTMLESGSRSRKEYRRNSDEKYRPVFDRMHHVHADADMASCIRTAETVSFRRLTLSFMFGGDIDPAAVLGAEDNSVETW